MKQIKIFFIVNLIIVASVFGSEKNTFSNQSFRVENWKDLIPMEYYSKSQVANLIYDNPEIQGFVYKTLTKKITIYFRERDFLSKRNNSKLRKLKKVLVVIEPHMNVDDNKVEIFCLYTIEDDFTKNIFQDKNNFLFLGQDKLNHHHVVYTGFWNRPMVVTDVGNAVIGEWAFSVSDFYFWDTVSKNVFLVRFLADGSAKLQKNSELSFNSPQIIGVEEKFLPGFKGLYITESDSTGNSMTGEYWFITNLKMEKYNSLN